MGAGTGTVFILIQMETIFVVLLGMALGGAGLALVVVFAERFVSAQYVIDIGLNTVTINHGLLMSYVLIGAVLVGLVPALAGSQKSRRVTVR